MSKKYTCDVCQSALIDTRPESIRRHDKSKKHLKALFSGINNGSITDETVICDARKKNAIVSADSFPIKEYPKVFRINFNGKTKNFKFGKETRGDALKNAQEFRDELMKKYSLE